MGDGYIVDRSLCTDCGLEMMNSRYYLILMVGKL